MALPGEQGRLPRGGEFSAEAFRMRRTSSFCRSERRVFQVKGTAFPHESSRNSDFFQSYQNLSFMWEIIASASCRGRCCPRLGLPPRDSAGPSQKSLSLCRGGSKVYPRPASIQGIGSGVAMPPKPEEISSVSGIWVEGYSGYRYFSVAGSPQVY